MALTASEEALVRQLLDRQAAILSLAGNEATITSKLGATKVTLADLVAASALADADLLLTRQGATDKSVRADILASYMGAELSALFAPIASPALTGKPTAPTAPAGTNTTQLATTEFVRMSFPASLDTNGYQKLPSGLIMQWGEGISNASGQLQITFPIAFTDAGTAYRIVAMHSGTGPAMVIEQFTSRTITGTRLDIFNTSNLPVNGGIIRWFAIGK